MKYELKSINFSIETLKNMMAQHVENYSTVHTDNDGTAVNVSYEVIWPVNDNEELENVEGLLNNQLVRINQVSFRYA